MNFAIVSDVHDNLANLDKFFKYIDQQKIDTILCCGDLGSKDTYNYFKSKFKGKLYAVSGNMDRDFQVELPQTIELMLDGTKIAIVHEPGLAKKLAETGKFDIVFYGHTHRPWQDTIPINADKTISADPRGSIPRKSATLVNPGNLAGILYQPTFAIYNSKNNSLELKVLNEI